MSKKPVAAHRTVAPTRIDDLKAIIGIGPGVEKRLNGIGIYTYTQLAALSSADIAAAVADLSGLSAERIIKQDWIGQARLLIGNAERSATFTIEFLLDERDEVHRLRVAHDQSGQEQIWTAWQSTQFVDFLNRCAGLHIVSEQPIVAQAQVPDYASVEGQETKFYAPPPAKLRLAGELHLRDLETIASESEEPRRILHHDQPFDVRLTLDLSEMTVPEKSVLRYKAAVFGKNRADHASQFAREAEGTLMSADRVTIDLADNTLSEGTYQLAASVTIGLPDMKLTPKPGSVAVIDGGIIQVV